MIFTALSVLRLIYSLFFVSSKCQLECMDSCFSSPEIRFFNKSVSKLLGCTFQVVDFGLLS